MYKIYTGSPSGNFAVYTIFIYISKQNLKVSKKD